MKQLTYFDFNSCLPSFQSMTSASYKQALMHVSNAKQNGSNDGHLLC